MIICCGEALIDMLPRLSDAGEKVYLPVSGGSIFNTAIALGRLGDPVGFISSISTDQFGRQLVESLKDSGVEHRFCVYSDRPTTLAFVQFLNGNAEYSFYDEKSAGRMFGVGDLPDLSPDISTLHFGAISLVSEPCGSTYETLMAREAGRRVISVDPNIRPRFITNDEMHRARIQRMIGLSDIIKVSDEDLAWIELDKTPRLAIENWLERGASVVLLTHGAEGAAAYTRSQEISVASEPMNVVDTVGAGDAFSAGFLSGLRQQGLLSKKSILDISRDSLEFSLQRAVKVAALTVAKTGANPPWKDEIF